MDDLLYVLRSVAADRSDRVTAMAAVHGIAAMRALAADGALADILGCSDEAQATHAAWATNRRPFAARLVPLLTDLVGRGGTAGMHAQATLRRWGRAEPGRVADALRQALSQESVVLVRRRIAETLGLLPGGRVSNDLARLAVDRDEADVVRIAAIAALGDRRVDPLPAAVASVARDDGPIAGAARLAIFDHERADGPWTSRDTIGQRIAQVHLGSEMDPDLRRSGVGDTGGIATLLVKLGDALVRTPAIDEVVTIGRGTAIDVLAAVAAAGSPHRFVPVPLGPDEHTGLASQWPARVSAERGLRRAFRAVGRPDRVHIRMADAGSLAAAELAWSMGVRTVFSLAPDPHALVAAQEASGEVDRRTFGDEDGRHQLWYRVHLVDRLARSADEVVLFPREDLADRLRVLAGVDIDARPGRFTVVPEGIDVAQIAAADVTIAAAKTRLSSAAPTGSALRDLLDRIAARPARRGLPIVLSVGRLTELKGMARLVEAFATDAILPTRATLVIVGGDIDHPTPDEREELARIHASLASRPEAADAAILLGHRPNAEVAHVMAAARHGLAGRIGAHGAYVSASRKEEFGLSIVEALAAGLPVVAPREGGPATYVEEGRTGYLVDTTDARALGAAIHRALDIADRPGRAERALTSIRREYDIGAMARTLASVYRRERRALCRPAS